MRKRWNKIKERFNKFLKRIQIPGYKPLTAYDFSKFYGNSLIKGNLSDRAAAMTFYFLLALFPLLIFIFSIIPFIPVDGLQNSLLKGIESALPTPEVYLFFQGFLEDLVLKRHSTALSLSFILGIYFSSNAIYSILSGLNGSYHLESKGKIWSQKLWSLALLFLFILLFIVSFVISTLSSYFLVWLNENDILTGTLSHVIFNVLHIVISFFFFILAISLLYNVANTEKRKWKIFSAGAFASALLILLFNELFGWYISSFNSYNSVYGQLGTVLILLLFMFYVFIMLMIGFELNTSLQKAHKKSSEANPLA